MWKIRTYRGHGRLHWVFIGTLLLISALSVAEDTEPTLWTEGISGELELGLFAGLADQDSDVTIDQYLRLNIDPPKHERLHIRTTLWLNQDLDGRESPSSAFRGLNDTSSTWITTRVFSLYMEVESEHDDSRIRLGRQRITDGVAYNRIDGVYFNTRQQDFNFYAFLGARASVYENSHEDVSTGAGVSWLSMPDTRVSLDVFYGDDERRRYDSDRIKATLTSLSIHHALAAQHYLFGRATWYEEHLDEYRLNAQGVVDEDKLLYTLSYRKRESTLAERPTDFPQFYYVVGELNGYEDVQGVISVPINKRIDVGMEAQMHDAENSSLSSGNRDYDRYGLSLDVREIAGWFDAYVILELWDADEGESEKTISGEVSRQWVSTRVALGVDYDRFQDSIIQYDLTDPDGFVVKSRDDIYSLYVKMKHDINESQSLRIRASVEDDDSVDAPLWLFRAHYTYRF